MTGGGRDVSRRRRWVAVAVGLSLVGAIVIASTLRSEPEPWPGQTEATASGSSPGAEVLRAIELPRSAQDARAAGIGENDLRATLSLLQEHGVSAADARAVLAAWLRLGATARGEPLADQVRRLLDGGVRGSALADALRAAPRAPAARTPRLTIPRDTPGERRPLRDTMRLPPPDSSGSRVDRSQQEARP